MPTHYPKADPSDEMRRYETHQGEISLHMSHFFLDYLREIYKAFEGDLALVIVLGEIAHHNLSTHFSKTGGLHPNLAHNLEAGDADKHRLPSCNAYSLAQATGMPRETIRRKIARLKALGWIEQAARAEVRITPKVAEVFLPDFNFNLMTNLLHTADRIRDSLNS
jgi:hypothetical protein